MTTYKIYICWSVLKSPILGLVWFRQNWPPFHLVPIAEKGDKCTAANLNVNWVVHTQVIRAYFSPSYMETRHSDLALQGDQTRLWSLG